MVKNFNRLFLLGHLARDPELHGNGSVCTFTLAIREWKNANGERQKEVGFFGCKAFGRIAELVSRYMTKGRALLVEGRLVRESWEKDGQNRSAVRVIAENVTFLGTGTGDGEG